MGAITRGIANNILGSGAVDGTDGLTGTIPATNIGNPSLANLTTFPPSVSAGIPEVAGDPPAPSDGDVWYNTVTYKLKVRGLGAGSWATGGNLNQDRYAISSSGTVTASIAFGGRISPPNAYSALNESYNGSAWTEVGNLNTARAAAGSTTGPYTAVLGFGGTSPTTNKNEQWNGTSWTETTAMNTAKSNVAGCGTTTSALATGGSSNTNEQWNGSAWAELADLNTARNGIGPNSSGTATATLVAGGEQPAAPYAIYANTESWNGASWTEVGDLNTARHQLGHTGTSTDALAFGGTPPNTVVTESWNGTSWAEVGDLNTARGYPASSGTAAAALAVGGSIPPGASSTATEEWTKSADNLNVDLA